MFGRGQDGVYRSSLLEQQRWLNHGFGSRLTPDWPGPYIKVRQIHSACVLSAADLQQNEPPEADGIVTNEEGKWVGIRTADCVPVLLADPVRRCVAAIHAGWKGTASNITATGVEKMRQRWNSRPEDIVAALGPAIGLCCFEVGPEVEEQFAVGFPEAIGRGRIDLSEANRRQLVAAGLRRENIDVAVECTKCLADEFHSWRRDHEASGRMVTAIRITGE